MIQKIVFCFLFIGLQLHANSQVIKGSIIDINTNEPVRFATIYFNGTFVGTASDENGHFSLDVSRYKRMPIIVSAIGYYSATVNEYLNIGELRIFLSPKIYNLDDAVVNASSLERKRKRYLKIFISEFIGETPNAEHCTILNEDDIRFDYDTDQDTVKAYAEKPLIIENQALGYIITYYLDKFEYYKYNGDVFFKGNLIFEDNIKSDISQKKRIKNKRRAAYYGSRMYFFRMLWKNNMGPSGLIIRNSSYYNLGYNDLVVSDNHGHKYLKYPDKIYISFNEQRSSLELVAEKIYFEESGFFNPNIKWYGEMANERIADWLPYEYSPFE